jgi:branched-chain amino acid aminotransferase
MKLVPTDRLWFDGKLVAWQEAQVHVLSHALHYASSAFEGLRAYATPRGPAIVQLAKHVERLFRTCKIIELPIPFTPAEVEAAILETVRDSRLESCYIRPLVFRGLGVLGVDPTGCPVHVVVAAWPHGGHYGSEARERGVSLGISSWRRMGPATHPAMVKAVGNYLNSQLIKLEARRHGYDDGIALDPEGHVCETSGANLFCYLDGRVITPPLDASVLPGITRACTMTLIREAEVELVEQRLAREMLHCADEVFMTGTAAEITPVRAVDGREVGNGARGPLVKRLQERFFEIVEGRAADRHGWLSYVS